MRPYKPIARARARFHFSVAMEYRYTSVAPKYDPETDEIVQVDVADTDRFACRVVALDAEDAENEAWGKLVERVSHKDFPGGPRVPNGVTILRCEQIDLLAPKRKTVKF